MHGVGDNNIDRVDKYTTARLISKSLLSKN